MLEAYTLRCMALHVCLGIGCLWLLQLIFSQTVLCMNFKVGIVREGDDFWCCVFPTEYSRTYGPYCWTVDLNFAIFTDRTDSHQLKYSNLPPLSNIYVKLNILMYLYCLMKCPLDSLWKSFWTSPLTIYQPWEKF